MININSKRYISVTSLPAPKLPFYSIQNNGENIYIYDAGVIRLLSKFFRVPYKILLPPDGEGGTKLPDGNWTGIIGMVQRSEVDIGLGTPITYPRFQAVNFTYPYLISDISFMTDKPKSDSTYLAIMHPFPLIMWILLIASIFLFACVLYLHVYRKETYQNILFVVFGSLLEESIRIQLRKCSFKLYIGVWFVFVFVILNSYKVILLSILTLPRLTGIRNIPDLAEAAEKYSVTCYSYKGASLKYVLLESEFLTWRSVGKCMQRNVINSEYAEEAFFNAPSKKSIHS